jgi:predicted dehydrogenase
MKTSSLVVAGGALAGTLGIARTAHAGVDETIKVALIGCGSRGSGAISDCLDARSSVKLVAMADLFPDRLKFSLGELQRREKYKGQIDVPEDRQFVGFDAYQKALGADPDLVILSTPPGFRPIHFEAAVEAGKHVFMEKPVATDPAGVRKVLKAAEAAKQKGLGVGVGLQRRHQKGYLDTMQRLKDGAIGDIIATRVYWNGTTPWTKHRAELERDYGRPLTEMEYQIRNWYYFTWICGDHIVEQHIHNLDVGNWLKDAYPVKANGMGGCEVRNGPDTGETFDHHYVEFTYEDGSKMYSQCRHIPGCFNAVEEHAHGSNGTCNISRYIIEPKNGERWSYGRARGDANPYKQEHADLLESIAAGKPYNEAEYGAKSTMTAILGRMCTYSGKELTWDEAINSNVTIMPTNFAFDATPPVLPDSNGKYARAIPGVTKVV